MEQNCNCVGTDYLLGLENNVIYGIQYEVDHEMSDLSSPSPTKKDEVFLLNSYNSYCLKKRSDGCLPDVNDCT